MIAVLWSDPVWKANRVQLGHSEPGDWQHEIHAVGGYWSASFSFNGDADDWIADGLGRDIEVIGPDLRLAWNGFVNSVSGSVGLLEVTRGPLLDVGNRAELVYATLNTVVYPPIVGNKVKTAAANDLASQGRWGIRYRILSTGGLEDATALQIRDTWLAENAEPSTQRAKGSGPGNVRIECLGYWHLLDYPYNNEDVMGDQNLSAKIAAVIAADPNSLFTTSITANTVQVAQAENSDRIARDLLEELMTIGDAADNRYLIGVYDDRTLIYEQAPTTMEYMQRIGDERVMTTDGAVVPPWLVRPGKWLRYVDLLPGRADALHEDARTEFIEYVTYDDAAAVASHTGVKDSKLARLLARRGLGRL